MKHSTSARAVAAILSLLVPASSLAQTIAGGLAVPVGGVSAPVVPMAAAAQGFLAAVNTHLDAASLSLPTASIPQASVLPEVRLDAAPGDTGSQGPRGNGVLPSRAARYLARAALATAPQARARSAEAEAARFLTAALADPAQRKAAVEALREAGPLGAATAEKLEKLGPAASDLESLQRLNEDFKADPQGHDVRLYLDEFFSGVKPRGAGETALGPEAFAAFAERLFHPGLEGRAAVAYRLQKSRPEGVAGDQELYDEVAISPLTNAERERAVVELFRQAGASPEEIRLQDAGRKRNNIYVIKKGRTDRVVVVGGHHDKVEGDGGRGTIDNWTGATMVTNLYQALRDVDTEATYVFIAFAREEEGLLGAERYLEELSRQERLKIDAMVNLDTLGVDGTYSWKNNSTKVLLELVKRVAGEGKFDLQEVSFWGGDADSTPFRRARIPAMTLFGASESVIWDVIHGVGDSIKALSLPHYKNAYLLTLALLKKLDAAPVRPLQRLARLAVALVRAVF